MDDATETGDAGERREGRVVQVPGDDRTDIGTTQHPRQAGLIAQLDARGEREDARHGRVVHREDRAERRRSGEHVGEPRELRVAELTVVGPRHARVERHEAQTVELIDPVDRRRHGARRLIEQARAELPTVVVIAHHPEHPGAQARGERLDERAQLGVGRALAQVDQIAGEHDAVGTDAGRLDHRECPSEVVARIDQVEQPGSGRSEVGVAQVQQHPLRCRILGRTHGTLPQSAPRSHRLGRHHRHGDGSKQMLQACFVNTARPAREQCPNVTSGRPGDPEEVLDAQLLAACGRCDPRALEDLRCRRRGPAEGAPRDRLPQHLAALLEGGVDDWNVRRRSASVPRSSASRVKATSTLSTLGTGRTPDATPSPPAATGRTRRPSRSARNLVDLRTRRRREAFADLGLNHHDAALQPREGLPGSPVDRD